MLLSNWLSAMKNGVTGGVLGRRLSRRRGRSAGGAALPTGAELLEDRTLLATINVPVDQATIQAAVNAANARSVPSPP